MTLSDDANNEASYLALTPSLMMTATLN